MTPKEAAVFFQLGLLGSEDLPELACHWLSIGLDCRELRILAGELSPAMAEVGPLFVKVLHQLKIPLPPKLEALFGAALFHCNALVNGSISPHECGNLIWWDVVIHLENPSELMSTFVGATSELDDIPYREETDGINREQYRLQLEDMISNAAREVLKLEKAEQMIQ